MPGSLPEPPCPHSKQFTPHNAFQNRNPNQLSRLNPQVYSEHGYQATVARFHPNGEWVASADVAGHVRVWASHTLGCEPVLKIEHHPLSGAVDDMQWSSDGQRIMLCGEGRGEA